MQPKSGEEPIQTSRGQDVAKKIGAREYIECSAKNGEGVREVFEHATRAALVSRTKKKRGDKCMIL
jgi:Ras family protein A